MDIRHVYIRPRTPHLNGKVERSHRIDDQEFCQLLDRNGISDDIHLLLRKYNDVPMSLADACLVDLADQMDTARILTLDRDFEIYRWRSRRKFELLVKL